MSISIEGVLELNVFYADTIYFIHILLHTIKLFLSVINKTDTAGHFFTALTYFNEVNEANLMS